jgi:hypothetical protein
LAAKLGSVGTAVAAERPAGQDLHHLGDLFLADQLNARSGHAGLPPVSLPCATDCTGPAQHDNLTVNTRLGRMEGRPDVSDLLERVAGAPITWGVDGSPGWGYLMGRDRVMREMVESGLSATELGPDGYLPTDPGELHEFLDGFGLSIVGGFVPALLYRPDRIEPSSTTSPAPPGSSRPRARRSSSSGRRRTTPATTPRSR